MVSVFSFKHPESHTDIIISFKVKQTENVLFFNVATRIDVQLIINNVFLILYLFTF